MRSSLLVVLLLAIAPRATTAQDSAATKLPDLPVATRVRLSANGLPVPYLTGRIAAMDSQRISVAVTNLGTTVTVPWRDVTSLGWSLGLNRLVRARNAAALALVAGGVVVATQFPSETEDPDGFKAETLVVLWLELFPLAAAGVGATTAKESWYPVTVPRFSNVVDAPVAGLEFSEHDDFRLSSGTLGPLRGRIVASTADTLMLRSKDDALLRLPRVTIDAIRVRGEPDRLTGALMGASILSFAVAIDHSITPSRRQEGAVLRFTLAGGAGALIGREFAPRKWTLLPLPQR